MKRVTPVTLFIFGLIIGSFLNVVGLRLNSGATFAGRSHCPNCGKTLSWSELLPLLSFVILGRRCRDCRSRISWQYPLVELVTGIVFVTVPLAMLPVFCLYIVIVVYDLRHKIIPDLLVYSAVALSLLTATLSYPAYSTLDWLAGPILFLFFGAVWLLSGGKAMGFGDAKLALSIGLLLGAVKGFSAVVVAFWTGAAIGLFLIALPKFYPLLRKGNRITMKSEIPFAPFLVWGAWFAVVFHFDLLHVSLL